MIRRRVALSAALAALAACTTATISDTARNFGPQIAALPPLAGGLARIVIARDDYVQGVRGVAQVTIATLSPAPLADGGLIARDVAPGAYAVGVASSDFDPAPADPYVATVAAGETAYVRILYFQTIVESPVAGNTPIVGQGGRGTILPGMATPRGAFRIEEMPPELR